MTPALLIQPCFFAKQLEFMINPQQLLTLLRGQLKEVLAVAITHLSRNFSAIFGNQAAYESADAQAQLVVLLPLLMLAFDLFLFMIDITQNAQIVIQASQYGI